MSETSNTTNNTEITSTIRQRVRVRPPLLYYETIDPKTAMLDRMEITTKGHCLEFTNNNSIEENNVSLENYIGRLGTGVHFTRQGGVNTLTIRNRLHLLLKGSQIIFRRNSTNIRFSVKLVFNPSRFLAHYFTNPPQQMNHNDIFRLDNNTKNALKNLTLNKGDNYIPRTWHEFHDYINPSTEKTYNLSNLLGLMRRWIRETLSAGINAEELNVDGARLRFDWNNWVINQSELYYEFSCENAIDAIQHISRYLPMVRGDFSSQTYEGSVGTEQEANSAKIQIPMTQDMVLIIYPKTTTILRCEFKKPTSLRKLTHLRGLAYNATPRINLGTDFEDIPSMLDVHAQYCSNNLTSLFNDIYRVSRDAFPDGNILPDFIRAIDTSTKGNQKLANQIWSLLSTNGSIDAIGQTTLRRACERLVESGYIEKYIDRRSSPPKPTNCFNLTASIRRALEPLFPDRQLGVLDASQD